MTTQKNPKLRSCGMEQWNLHLRPDSIARGKTVVNNLRDGKFSGATSRGNYRYRILQSELHLYSLDSTWNSHFIYEASTRYISIIFSRHGIFVVGPESPFVEVQKLVRTSLLMPFGVIILFALISIYLVDKEHTFRPISRFFLVEVKREVPVVTFKPIPKTKYEH